MNAEVSLLFSYREVQIANLNASLLNEINLILDGGKEFDRTILDLKAIKRLQTSKQRNHVIPDASKRSAIDQLKLMLKHVEKKMGLKFGPYHPIYPHSYVDSNFNIETQPFPNFAQKFNEYFHRLLVSSSLCEVLVVSNATLDDKRSLRALKYTKT